MSIRFACPHCRQSLHVADRQAGQPVRCARCHQTVHVPEHPLPPSSQPDESWDALATLDAPAEPPGDEPERQLDRSRSRTSNDYIQVHRRVLYTQGLLLVVIGIVCFMCGLFAGRRTASDASAQLPPSDGPHMLVGQVGYYDEQGRWTPDEGSVLWALPDSQQPDEKLAAAELSVEEPLPIAVHPTLVALELLGGAYGRADAAGRFRLRVPEAGRYYVVCVSRHVERHEAESTDRTTLAILGRFFSDVAQLLGQQQYQGTYQEVAGRTEVEVTFSAERVE